MIPHRLNPMGIDRDYPLMVFEKDGNLFDGDITGQVKMGAVLSLITNGMRATQDVAGVYKAVYKKLTFSECGGRKLIIKGSATEFNGAKGRIMISFITNSGTNLGILASSLITSNTFRFEVTIPQNMPVGANHLALGINTSMEPSVSVGAYIDFTNIMISEEDIPYDPYNPNTYCVYGKSTQSGTPSPKTTIPIISNYPKGVYKTNIPEFPYIRLYDDLRGIGSYRDKIIINTADKTKLLTKQIQNFKMMGTETVYAYFMYTVKETTVSIAHHTPSFNQPPGLQNTPMLCTHLQNTTAWDTTPGKVFMHTSMESHFYTNWSKTLVGITSGDDNTTIINKVKAYISNQYNTNPIAIYYVITTPINQYL